MWPCSERHIQFDTSSAALKLPFCTVTFVLIAQLRRKAITNKRVSLGLGQTRPVRSASGEHFAAPEGEARARSQWRSSERPTCPSRGGPETSEHDGVSCHKGEALILNVLFGAEEMDVPVLLTCLILANTCPTSGTGVAVMRAVEVVWT